MAAGALTAAAAALEPAAQQPQLAASPPAQALVSTALQLGLAIAVDLRRPPDVTSDEDMTELVDEVCSPFSCMSPAAKCLHCIGKRLLWHGTRLHGSCGPCQRPTA